MDYCIKKRKASPSCSPVDGVNVVTSDELKQVKNIPKRERLKTELASTDVSIDRPFKGVSRLLRPRVIDGNNIAREYIVKLAADIIREGGVIFSNNTYKEIVRGDSVTLKKTVEERLLMFCFVGDILMVPDDPLGRYGPHIDVFIQFPENESI